MDLQALEKILLQPQLDKELLRNGSGIAVVSTSKKTSPATLLPKNPAVPVATGWFPAIANKPVAALISATALAFNVNDTGELSGKPAANT